ncbi:LamG-like jellyroll fold domain-containing protein [Adhaeribacter soli]|uniref:T9SS type A sorting domain-containing protein n=1 Tax=Adhaeribacter soli TaxID=2607655 RepID=A0A5N1J1R0_9BACT|nr:LamG-like jellyroll fold domain-containing protein [Adhaeribacter soli]KAA9340723.1 T9SS type A sorting domain-containing protein [Adhaeribacter soli]
MKKITILFLIAALLHFRSVAQFSSVTSLNPVSVKAHTGEKPQSKVWVQDGKQWAVMVTGGGTYVHRLDSTSWTRVLKLSSSEYGHADCKSVGNVTHILLFKGKSCDLFSVEYVPSTKTYKPWSVRSSKVDLELDDGVETATIDMDTHGRLWLASDGTTDINVRWSDSPYNVWSPPITIGSGTSEDDICSVIAMPTAGKVGVLWSNQISKRFGFRTHTDGALPTSWSADEVPASQSALDVGNGFSDDHLNLKISSNGTLYCAVKTSYDKPGYPRLSLLVRRPSGTWDNLYKVSESGTRSIALLNELADKITIVYTEVEDGGDILYRESKMSNISFGSVRTLISGKYNNPSSTKQTYNYDVAVLASNSDDVVGFLGVNLPPPSQPVLASPANSATNIDTQLTLTWNTSAHASSYQVQVSTSSSFSSTVFNQVDIPTNSVQVRGLVNNTTYYWRVKASGSGGSSSWSPIWSFNIKPQAPTLASPQNNTLRIDLPSVLTWNALPNVTSYQLLVASRPDFVVTWLNKTALTSTSFSVTGLTNNTIYYWKVRAVSSKGTSDWSTAWQFKTILATPAQSYPTDAAPGLPISFTIKWGSSAGASSYQLQISSTQDFSSLFMDRNGLTTTSSNISGLANHTTYYWRVRAANSEGNSNWSPAWSFTTIPATPATPVLSAPVNQSTGNPLPPTLTWNPATNAQNYIVQVSANADFTSPVFNQSNITGTSVPIPNLAHSTNYYWRVMANNYGVTSNWSNVWQFKTSLPNPTLLAPANNATSTPVSLPLTWNAISDAGSYQVQVSTAADFSSLLLDQNNLKTNSVNVSGLANHTTYFWRVRAANSEGNSNWSPAWSFTTIPATPATPVLSAPVNQSTGNPLPPTLTWNPATNAQNYIVQVSANADFTSPVFNQSNITGTSVPIPNLAHSTNYYWRVMANNYGVTSNWSNVWQFKTTLPTPTLTTPANNVTDQPASILFSWNAAAGAGSYQLQISTVQDFGTLFLDQDNLSATSSQVTTLNYRTTYFWRVRARNTEGNSNWSAVRTFTTMPPILAGHWKFDESSGTVVSDASEYLNHGSMVGTPTKSTGITGLAINLNGTDQYVTVPNNASLNITKQITLSAWIKPSRTGVSQVIMKKAITDKNNGYELALTSSGLIFVRFNQDSNGDTYRLNSTAVHPSDGNTWMHVAATYNGSVLKLYINGTEHKTKTFSSPPTIKTNTLPLAIGAQSNGSNPFQGAIDDARVYNIALSPAEINALATIPPSKPTLVSPADLASGMPVPVTLSWNTAAGAPTYQVQVSTAADFSANIFDQSGIAATSVQVNAVANNTRYYWRVKATNVTGSSSWSSVRSFFTNLDAPVLNSPADASNGVAISPTLKWNAASAASAYQVQVSTAANFATIVFDQSNIGATSVQVPALANNVTYYWRVKAANAGNSSAWSNAWTFTTIPVVPPKPVLASPADLTTSLGLPPTLTWNPATDATSYQIQVAGSSDFIFKTYDQSGITATSAQIPGLDNNKQYFWRVKAFNLAGSSSWSTAWKFTTSLETPVLATPANEATAVPVDPTLSWTKSNDATAYQLQIASTADFSSPVVDQSNITAPSVQVNGLANNVKYYWRVKALTSSNSSNWSGTWTFTTIPLVPSKPVLVSPVDLSASASVPPTLVWNASSDAAAYQVQVATTPDFTTKVFEQTGLTATSVQASGLANNTQYFWRVKASNVAGSSNWSAVWSFTTVPPNLVGYWKMDEATGTLLTDGSGFSNNATTSGGPTRVTGVAGLALNLNGTNQYATAPNSSSLTLTSGITLAAWIRPSKTGVSQVILKKAITDQSNGYELCLASDGKIFFRINQDSNGDTYRLNSSVTHPTNGATWMHIAVTYDGTTAKMYINGVEHKTKTFSTAIKTSSAALGIGAQNTGSNRFQGAIDEARIYKVALSAGEISALAAIQPSQPNLVSPVNLASNVAVPPTLSWDAAAGAPTYQAQVSTTADFTSLKFDQSNLTKTSVQVSGLANTTQYYWRVRAINASGTSSWSTVWSFTTGASIPTLAGNWRMEETSGTTLTDASSFGNNGVTTGSPGRVTGVSGLALSLNGSSQYATVPNSSSLNPTTAITLAAWIRPSKTGTSQVVLKKGITSESDGYELSLSSDAKIFFRINQDSNGDTYRLNSSTTHPTSGTTWMHIAATYDGTTARLYINGVEHKTKTYSTTIKSSTAALGIGAQSNGSNRFQGALDEAKVYNVALSPEEIRALATATIPSATARQQAVVQDEFRAYPNPYHTTATIRFTLPETTEYTLSMYDFNGKQIAVLKQGVAKAGETINVETNGRHLKRGLYLVKLQTHKKVRTLSMMLEK